MTKTRVILLGCAHTNDRGYWFRSLATTQLINRRGIHRWLVVALRIPIAAAYNLTRCESLGFDFGYPNHFGPFFNFPQDEPAKFGRCHWHGYRSEISKALP